MSYVFLANKKPVKPLEIPDGIFWVFRNYLVSYCPRLRPRDDGEDPLERADKRAAIVIGMQIRQIIASGHLDAYIQSYNAAIETVPCMCRVFGDQRTCSRCHGTGKLPIEPPITIDIFKSFATFCLQSGGYHFRDTDSDDDYDEDSGETEHPDDVSAIDALFE
ncbi:MAG: hypothetical protein WC525_10240 [Candidatus Thermoplasmatota archaeon]